jgi:hypothetical protein
MGSFVQQSGLLARQESVADNYFAYAQSLHK